MNLSYGKSDNQELPSSFEEGHNENITQWKIKEGYKQDEVIQDELDEESNEFKWIIETKEDDNKCVYIKSAVGGKDCEDFYLIIDGYVPKPHAKIVIGPYEQSQKFMLCRKV